MEELPPAPWMKTTHSWESGWLYVVLCSKVFYFRTNNMKIVKSVAWERNKIILAKSIYLNHKDINVELKSDFLGKIRMNIQ